MLNHFPSCRRSEHCCLRVLYNSKNDLDDSNVNAVNSFAKRFFQTSEEYLGNDRGYILTDGTILEFGPNMDHASISSVGHQTIGSFLSLGNIRIGEGSIELATEPTFAQRKQLRKFIQYNSNSEIYVDIKVYDSVLFKSFTLIILYVISYTLIEQISVSYTWREE